MRWPTAEEKVWLFCHQCGRAWLYAADGSVLQHAEGCDGLVSFEEPPDE